MSLDTTTSEEEYFHKQAVEQLARLREIAAIDNAEAAAKAARELHFHKCGKCGADMATEIFKGVEIERCGCGSVLLDPGELEQLAGKDESGFFADLFGSNK
jgi:uncharacterized protein